MFSHVSWSQFLSTLGLLLLFYYAGVLGIYFRKDLVRYCRLAGWKWFSRMPYTSAPKEYSVASEKEDSNELHNVARVLMGRLHTTLGIAAQRGYPKAELLTALQQELAHYQPLTATSFRRELDHFMVTECSRLCHIHLEAYDLKCLWDGSGKRMPDLFNQQ